MSDTWDSAPLAPAVAPQRSNTWDAAPLASGPSPQQRAVVSANDNGDDAARALSISKKINVPAPVVQSDLLGYTEHERTQSAKRASENPATAKYIQANPLAASASSDDWDAMEEASATLRALHPELMTRKVNGGVIAAVPEIAELAGTPQGREKLYGALKKLPGALAEGVLDFFKTPGEVAAGKIDLTTAEGLDQGISLGLGIALGAGASKGTMRVGKAEPPVPPSGDYMSFDDFMHKMEGFKTRQEIDDFLASRQPGPPGAMLQITKAEAGAEALSRAVEVAQESKTKQRSPELFAEFGNAHDAGSVHVDAAKIIELYQKEGKVPAEGDGLFGFVPDLAQKAQAAAATGGEVTIPIGSYIAHVDPAVHEGLRDSVRLHNDGVTLEEAKEAQAAIEAWHGTPHDFEQFDLTKIGTGEGAQVYGHGLYFAENRKVSEGYAEKLAPTTVGGKPYDPKTDPMHALIELSNGGKWDGVFAKSRADYIKLIEGDIADMEASNRPGDKQQLAFYKQKLAILKSGREIPNFDDNKGNLVKVSINADPTKFLDWDLPFDQQSQFVRDTLAAHEIIGDMQMKGQPKGAAFYHALQDHIRETKKDLAGHDDITYGNKDDFAAIEASKMLAKAGIPGIKYLDQGSRGALEKPFNVVDSKGSSQAGFKTKAEAEAYKKELEDNLPGEKFSVENRNTTRNFVVFDDKLVKITEKNGNPVVQATAASAEQQKKVLHLDGMFKDVTPEKVAGAAIKVNNKIYTGIMHADAYEAAKRELKLTEEQDLPNVVDGFVTSTGRFVDRKEAVEIAERQDQLRDPFTEKKLKKEEVSSYADPDPNKQGLHIDFLGNTDDISYSKVAEGVDAANKAAEGGKPPYLQKLFKDAKSVGITEAEFKRYSDLLEKADAYVLERAVRLNRSQIAQSVTAEWKRNEAAVRDEVTRELTETGAFAAERFLRQQGIELKASDKAPSFKQIPSDWTLSIEARRSHMMDPGTPHRQIVLKNDAGRTVFEALLVPSHPEGQLPGYALSPVDNRTLGKTPIRGYGPAFYVEMAKAVEKEGKVLYTGVSQETSPSARGVQKSLEREGFLDVFGEEFGYKKGAVRTTTKSRIEITEIADELAPLFGFETGQDLLRGLEAIDIERAASKKGPQTQLRDAIKAETAARMEERYGRLAENIAKEARDIALADHSFDIMAEEVRILAELSGTKPPLTRDEMVAWAKDTFERSSVADAANYEKHQRAVAKGGREAEKALLKGDYVEALQAKQRQMLAATVAKQSLALQRLIDQTERKIDRFSSEQVIKSIDQAHLEQIREMLASVGVEQVHLPSTEPAPLRDFVTAAEGQLAVAPWLFENPPKIADMTVTQFREFTDSLKSMEHVGRWATKLENAMGEADLQNVVFDAVKELERFPFKDQPTNNPSFAQRLTSVGRKIVGMHLLVERALDYTDKFNPHGPLTEWLDRPLRDANAKEIQLTESVVRDLKKLKAHSGPEILEQIPNTLIPDSMDKTGFMKMTRQNLRVLMLNMGNWSNMRKLVEGFGVQETDLRRFVDANAKPSDVAWVNGIWDIFGKLKPEADAVQVKDTGVPVDTIEGVPWKVKAGALKGGYYPMSYDPYNSDITGHIARPLFDRGYFSAATPHGYTKARTEYSGAIDLSGDFLSSKLQGMVHDIAFRLPVRNANKLIENQEFRTAMAQYWGKEVADLLPGWLRDIANSHNIDDNYAKGFVRASALIRQNVVSTLIAYNPGTFIKHGFTAAVMSADRVGLGPLLGATSELGLTGAAKNIKELAWKSDRIPDEAFMQSFRDLLDQGERGENARQFILDSSAVMRARQRQYNESIRGATDEITNSGMAQNLADFRQRQMLYGRMAVAFSDQMSAMPTWLAAYKKAYAEGEAHADAVFIADKEVSRAHGSGFIGDKPMVSRASNTPAGEFTRWFTTLYNFWNHQQNNQFQLAWDTAARTRGNPSGEPGANAASISRRLALIMGIIFIEEMAGPAKDEHGHGLLMQLALATTRFLGGGYIGLREVTNGLAHGYEPSTGMIGTLFKGGTEVAKDLAKASGAKAGAAKDWIRNTMTAIGFATGVGGTQVGRTGQFVYDVARGKDQPRTFNDYRQGLRTGHSKGRKFK